MLRLDNLYPCYPRSTQRFTVSLRGTIGTYNTDSDSIIGEGATSIVLRAACASQHYAVKLLHPVLSICNSDDALARISARFRHEAASLRSLQHAHVVPVVDTGVVSASDNPRLLGAPFFVMPYVEGHPLSSAWASRSSDTVLRILSSVADALDYLASRGILHRDIKPENIIVAPSHHALLVDYGVTQWPPNLVASGSITGSHEVLTTWKYLAPEIEESSRHYSFSSDIWALGVTMIESLLRRRIPRAHVLLRTHAFEGYCKELIRGGVLPAVVECVKHMVMEGPVDRPTIATVAGFLRECCRSEEEVQAILACGDLEERSEAFDSLRHWIDSKASVGKYAFGRYGEWKHSDFEEEQPVLWRQKEGYRLLLPVGSKWQTIAKRTVRKHPSVSFVRSHGGWSYKVQRCPRCSGCTFASLETSTPEITDYDDDCFELSLCLGTATRHCSTIGIRFQHWGDVEWMGDS